MYGYILLLARNTHHYADSLLETLALQQKKKLQKNQTIISTVLKQITDGTRNRALMSKINQCKSDWNSSRDQRAQTKKTHPKWQE